MPHLTLVVEDDTTLLKGMGLTFSILEEGGLLASTEKSSTRVFHSPHWGHFPIHWAWTCPQDEQRKILLAFDITAG
jgi:hypothetical protein